MADYYPLIARAVAGLDRNSGDARRALYERARAALVAQLRGVTPALNESDVTRERLALEVSAKDWSSYYLKLYEDSEREDQAYARALRAKRGADVGPDGVARFDRSGMIRLVARAPRGNHVLTLVVNDPGLQVYVFTFGP